MTNYVCMYVRVCLCLTINDSVSNSFVWSSFTIKLSISSKGFLTRWLFFDYVNAPVGLMLKQKKLTKLLIIPPVDLKGNKNYYQSYAPLKKNVFFVFVFLFLFFKRKFHFKSL